MFLIILLKSFSFGFGFLSLKLVHDFNDDEEGKANNDEGNDGIDEGTPIDDSGHLVGEGCAVLFIKIKKLPLPIIEVDVTN